MGKYTTGGDEIRANLRAFQNKFPRSMGAALLEEAEIDAIEVIERTPIDKGNLRDSIRVEGPIFEGKNIGVLILAGGPEYGVTYAVEQHENLEYYHEVGQAKYLESVIMEQRPFIAARIAAKIDFSILGA